MFFFTIKTQLRPPQGQEGGLAPARRPSQTVWSNSQLSGVVRVGHRRGQAHLPNLRGSGSHPCESVANVFFTIKTQLRPPQGQEGGLAPAGRPSQTVWSNSQLSGVVRVGQRRGQAHLPNLRGSGRSGGFRKSFVGSIIYFAPDIKTQLPHLKVRKVGLPPLVALHKLSGPTLSFREWCVSGTGGGKPTFST